MNKELFETILVQLEPELAQKFVEEIVKMENELKEYESRKHFLDNIDNNVLVFEPKEVWEEKLKKLKALEIIKSKEMLSIFKDISGKCFIVFNNTAIEIPQEEYDILKRYYYELF